MGTVFSVAIVCEEKSLADSLGAKAESNIRAYEARFSRFLPESELSILNATGEQVVSETFLDVILEARKLFTQTRGVFNPLVQIGRLGYTTTFESIESAHKDDGELYDIDFSATRIDEGSRTVRLNPGQKLDFGGFLKGYLAERIAREVQGHSPLVTGVIINLGGDVHTRGFDASGDAFAFTIYNPVTGEDGIVLPLLNTSLATSGTYKRAWVAQGTEVHHILDASGERNPDTDIISASVVHREGGAAEAYAKVFLSLGSERGTALLRETNPNAEISYTLITRNGNIVKNTL